MERGFWLHYLVEEDSYQLIITTQRIKTNKVFKTETNQDLILNDEHKIVFLRRRYGLQVSSLRASRPRDEWQAIKNKVLFGKDIGVEV